MPLIERRYYMLFILISLSNIAPKINITAKTMIEFLRLPVS